MSALALSGHLTGSIKIRLPGDRHICASAMQLRDVFEQALKAHFFKCFKQAPQVFWSRFSCG